MTSEQRKVVEFLAGMGVRTTLLMMRGDAEWSDVSKISTLLKAVMAATPEQFADVCADGVEMLDSEEGERMTSAVGYTHEHSDATVLNLIE